MMSDLTFLISAGGFVMYPLAALSIVALAVILERGVVFYRIGRAARGLLGEVVGKCREAQFDGAISATRRSSGPVAAALETVLEHRERPVETIERFVQEVGEEYFIRLERHLSVLDTITTISPLLGLLGTILGMIRAFHAISAQQAAQNTDVILHGVAEALYATATGIAIAVVCFMAYNYFAARLRHLTSETEMSATKLLNELSDT
jgi:biopolymer transport protein ExbB